MLAREVTRNASWVGDEPTFFIVAMEGEVRGGMAGEECGATAAGRAVPAGRAGDPDEVTARVGY